jgi:hypothetical protein
MHPACQICRGACCESIVTPRPPGPDGEWLAHHGTPLPDGRIELPLRCGKLSPCGTCTIHATRPQTCIVYEVGSPACRATVARRRPAQADEILAAMNGRDEGRAGNALPPKP